LTGGWAKRIIEAVSEPKREVEEMAGPFENLPEISPADKTVAVLAVSPHAEDHNCLRAIFSHSNWRIACAGNCKEAIRYLQTNRMAVIVCESRLPDGNWKNLLEALMLLPFPPLLVVTSRHADDNLWAEVLNLGAYDVLSKPFDRAEVTRIISLAWLHWKDQLAQIRQKPVVGAATARTQSGASATA
jgi:DNA-binding NtrC family response regulator